MDIKTSQNFARQAPVAPPSFDPSLWVGVYDFSARMPSAEPICYDKRFCLEKNVHRCLERDSAGLTELIRPRVLFAAAGIVG
jgi:hypothetical protein